MGTESEPQDHASDEHCLEFPSVLTASCAIQYAEMKREFPDTPELPDSQGS